MATSHKLSDLSKKLARASNGSFQNQQIIELEEVHRQILLADIEDVHRRVSEIEALARDDIPVEIGYIKLPAIDSQTGGKVIMQVDREALESLHQTAFKAIHSFDGTDPSLDRTAV